MQNEPDDTDEDDLMAGGASVGSATGSRIVIVLWIVFLVFAIFYFAL